MKRRRLSKLQKVKLFDQARGRCHICGLRIHAERGEKWDAEHIVPLSAGGADDIANLAPAHKACHRGKSDGEATSRAKEIRQRAGHLGVKSAGPKLPCGRMSVHRKTIKGRIVERRTQAELHRSALAARYGGYE